MAAENSLMEEAEGRESRAFLVLRHLGELSVVDLPEGTTLTIGSAPDSGLRLDAARSPTIRRT